MKIFAAIIILGIVMYVVSEIVSFFSKISESKRLVASTKPFEIRSDNTRVSILVLGDSTAVGVGARNLEDTVAGLMAKSVSATHVENRAFSGAQVSDLKTQIQSASLEKYSYILIMIGGNDIIRFHRAGSSANLLEAALRKLPQSHKTILVSAANVGGSTLFPIFLRPFYTRLNLQYHATFGRVAETLSVVYVNLYLPPGDNPFIKEPGKYLAADGLHPSSEGYKIWWKQIQKNMR